MKINISEILSNPSVIKNFKVEPDFEKLKLRRGSYPVSYKEPFLFILFMGYKVIYISQAEHLHLYLDNLKVEKENTDILIPIADIQILVIDNYKAYLTVPLMNKLSEKNVCTILCGVDHLPKTYILPMNGNYATSGNIAKQIEWTDETKKILHREIVKHKIINQYIILRKNHKSEDVVSKLKEYSETVLNGDITNREGLASKMYFREMYGEDFIRMDEDVVNAGLNYGYR
mgnify:CR=1 FL=1